MLMSQQRRHGSQSLYLTINEIRTRSSRPEHCRSPSTLLCAAQRRRPCSNTNTTNQFVLVVHMDGTIGEQLKLHAFLQHITPSDSRHQGRHPRPRYVPLYSTPSRPQSLLSHCRQNTDVIHLVLLSRTPCAYRSTSVKNANLGTKRRKAPVLVIHLHCARKTESKSSCSPFIRRSSLVLRGKMRCWIYEDVNYRTRRGLVAIRTMGRPRAVGPCW